MRLRFSAGCGTAALGALLLVCPVWAGQKLDYPPANTGDVVDELHGQRIPDPYRWLEDGQSPEVQAWTEAQNALTRRLLDQFSEQRAALRRQLDQLYSITIASTPAMYGKRYFFLKREGLANHAVLYVREGSPDAPPRVVLDPNKFSQDGTVALDWWFPSPDGRLIAYGKSEAGSEKSTLYLRDVEKGEDVDQAIPYTRFASVAWDRDGGGFTYTRNPEPGSVPAGDENYYRHVYYHKLGTPWRDDPRIWGEGQPKEVMPGVGDSSDYNWQFLTLPVGWSRNDLFIRKMGTREFRPVVVGVDALFSADVLGDRLYIRTNYQAPRYRIMVTSVDQPAMENWKEVVPEGPGVITGFAIADGRLVLQRLEKAFSRVSVHDPEGRLLADVELPTLGTVSGLSCRPDQPRMFFRFESFAYPPVVYECQVASRGLKVLERLEVPLRPDDYETRQVWFKSKDGTDVSMFVVHRKGLPRDGSNPVILNGYGGFNHNQVPQFRTDALPWLEAGGVYAVACIRGDGEFGEEWHRAGQLERRQNVFDDFIAAGEKLIADGYTSKERLAARGGSNGGLLMGAMMVQRPDLFRAIHCAVPLLDMLRYHRLQIARLWIPEYGSAEDPEQFKFLYAYSPYHHVKPNVCYPAVLFTTAESDSRVDPMHARKMAAAVQAATSCDRPVLLIVETRAGHGSGKPLTKYLDDQVDAWTFLNWQLGVWKRPS